MKERFPRAVRWLAGFGLAAVFLTQLGSFSLLEPDEGRYAEIGREMALPGGDWLIPHLNGVPHFQKPPVFYWATATAMKLFGFHEFAARLPSALAALAILALVFDLGRRLFGTEPAAWYSVLILASSPLFLFLARTVTPDMTLSFWITASIYGLVRSCPDREVAGPRHRGWIALFFLCMGLGFLTKGPVAFLVPVSAAVGEEMGRRRGRREVPIATRQDSRIPWIPGILFALAVGLSWFLVSAWKTPGLASYFWQDELLARFGSHHHGRSKPLWFFVPVILGGFLPWSILLYRGLRERDTLSASTAGRFLGWVLLPFFVLSLSGSKLPTYVLPLFPGLALFLGGTLAASGRRGVRFGWMEKSVIALVLIVIGSLGFLVAAFVLPPGEPLEAWSIISLVVIVILTVTFLFFRSYSPGEIVVATALLGLAGWLAVPSQVPPWNDLLAQQASVRPLAERIDEETRGERGTRRVIACEIRAHGLAFYLRQPVEMTRNEGDVLPFLDEKGDRFPVLHDRPSDVARLDSAPSTDERIFVVTRHRRYERDFAGRNWSLLQEAGDFVLLEKKTSP